MFKQPSNKTTKSLNIFSLPIFLFIIMISENEEGTILLPHHEQQPLCTTRLPYRQGRKLTAVKVYTVNNESNHLLIFGVPSLNLRQEAKSLFLKFGRLIQFNISKNHPAEPFTETYHAVYERIQSARVAKKMLDTKNFYGGSLHVCYSPEFESVEETRQKLMQRQKDVLYRLRNLKKETLKPKEVQEEIVVNNVVDTTKLNMGEENIIHFGNKPFNRKRKKDPNVVIEKKFKPCFKADEKPINNERNQNKNDAKQTNNDNMDLKIDDNVEVVDCTSTEVETITNINESLNYNSFGTEIVRKIPEKPVNRIKFNINKK